MSSTRRLLEILLITMVVAAAMFAAPSDARAFCGFYVSDASGDLYNDASQVVMMRHGTQTILSMRNNYQGPPKDFALVVPVPQILKKEDVKTLDDSVFDHITKFTAPRLVEYWERKSCSEREYSSGIGLDQLLSSKGGGTTTAAVSRFEVGEYDVVILSSKESNSLEKWLLDHGYNIPKGASKALAPYIAQGMYFFVAKVNAKKVKFDSKGNALLSPLRFHYNSEDFSLPVRLGLLNAKGTQDLIVHTLGLRQRYKVSNYKNVTIPTNLVVPDRTRKTFGSFYNGLFDYTMEQNRGAVVTEYAWDSAKCDPCAGPTLNSSDLHTLGLDILQKSTHKVERKTSKVTHVSAMIGSDKKLERNVRAKMSRKRGELLTCYERFLETSPAEPSGRIAVEFEIDEEGTTSNFAFPWNSLGDDAFANCVSDQVASLRLPPDDARGQQRMGIGLAFDYSVREEPINVPNFGWTLTRLHTRYTSKTMTEDLIFEKARPIVGGVGMPQGERGEFALEGAHFAGYNTFQGRYIILHYDESKLSCKKSERSYYWGGPEAGSPGISAKATPADSSVTSVARKSAELSSKMKAAAKRQYHQPKRF